MEFVFHHIALSVSDIERSVQFYEKLGLKRVLDYVSDDGEMKITQLKFGAAILELFWYKNAKSLPAHARSLSSDLPVIGTKHFGFRVENLDEALARLQELGIEIAEQPKTGRTGVRYCFFKDPDGTLVEVSQDDRDV